MQKIIDNKNAIKANIGLRAPKNKGYAHKVKINISTMKIQDFWANVRLYFSQPNKIPAKTKPQKANENAQIVYAQPRGNALLGNTNNIATLSALPPKIQERMPKIKNTSAVIPANFSLISRISWVILSKKEFIHLTIFKKITSLKSMRWLLIYSSFFLLLIR